MPKRDIDLDDDQVMQISAFASVNNMSFDQALNEILSDFLERKIAMLIPLDKHDAKVKKTVRKTNATKH